MERCLFVARAATALSEAECIADAITFITVSHNFNNDDRKNNNGIKSNEESRLSSSNNSKVKLVCYK